MSDQKYRIYRSLRGLGVTLGSALMAAAFLAATAPADAVAGGPAVWTVTEATGDARIRQDDGEWEHLFEGQIVSAGSEVEAGENSQITMVRGDDSITFSPGSRAAVPTDTGDASGPSLLQRLGTLLFRMETRESRDFTVQTPVLAAAIKGTIFTVTVDGDRSMVHVAEGMVEVTSLSNGEFEMVDPGETATVMAGMIGGPTVVDGQALLLDRLGVSPGAGAAGDDDDDPSDPDDSSAREADDDDDTLSSITTTLGETEVDVEDVTDGLVDGEDPETASLELEDASDDSGTSLESDDGFEAETLENDVETPDFDSELNDPLGNAYGYGLLWGPRKK